jgi:PAS domain S-box-containing protein
MSVRAVFQNAPGDFAPVNQQRSIRVLALKIALPYALLGGLWILLSDQMLVRLTDDAHTITTLQMYKGWFFVFMSATVVYMTAERYISHFFKAERKLRASEQALSESQRTLLTLMRNLPGMAYRGRCGDTCVLEYVSDGCIELTGYWPAEIVGPEATSYRQIIHPQDLDRVTNSVNQAISDSGAFQLEYRIYIRDGRMKWVWEQGCSVPSTGGDLPIVEGYIFDITEKKQLEEQNRLSERMKNIGQAASSIIHDFKNPLQVILGHVDLYRMEPDSDDTPKHFDQIERQVENMTSMCRELLDYARGEIRLDLDMVDISGLVAELVETYRPTFEMAGITLSYTQRQEPETSLHLALDRERIGRAVMNLVGNAKEAISGKGQISIRTLVSREEVRIDIQDSGPGIPDDIRDTLFEPFVTHGKLGGTGLGLAITKRIVEAHHGSISFSSDHRVGTTFVLRIPRLSIKQPEPAPAAELVSH